MTSTTIAPSTTAAGSTTNGFNTSAPAGSGKPDNYAEWLKKVKGAKDVASLIALCNEIKSVYGVDVGMSAAVESRVADAVKASRSFKAGDIAGIGVKGSLVPMGRIDQRLQSMLSGDLLVKAQKWISRLLSNGDGASVFIVWGSKEVRLTACAYSAFVSSICLTPSAYDALKPAMKRFFAAGVNMEEYLVHAGADKNKFGSFLAARNAGMEERKESTRAMREVRKVAPPVLILDKADACIW